MKNLKVLSVLVVVAVFIVLAYSRGYIANSATYLNAGVDSVVIGKKGGTITLKVAANESYAERICYITLHSDQLVRRLYYRQPGTGVRQQVIRKVNIEPCSECGGLGKLLTEVDIMTGERIYKTCPVCHGTGKK